MRVSFLVLAAAASAAAKNVVLSNTALPTDDRGQLLLTGEASVLFAQGAFYLYFNNWGGCAGVDCCGSSSGCASCCFNPPSPTYPDPCVYTANHSVVAYRTTDFTSYTYLGDVLPISARRAGIEFRPQVIWNAATSTAVMWYEDRWSSGTNRGYAVATAPTPAGPFTTVVESTTTHGSGRVGDYDLFVDGDGSAYHVRTGVVVERLNATYTGTTGAFANFNNGGVEGPSMFVRKGTYYITLGVGCCACRGGSNIEVYTASSPLGPWTARGDVGSNHTLPFDRHSPWNYVTRAQGSKVFNVTAADGSEQFVWLGNQWVSSTQPGMPRNHDLLYWSLLEFDDTVSPPSIKQFVRMDSVTLSLPG